MNVIITTKSGLQLLLVQGREKKAPYSTIIWLDTCYYHMTQ